MGRHVASLTLDTLGGLPDPCRGCVFWEEGPRLPGRADALRDAVSKESWVSGTLLEWGSCGQVVSVDGAPAGYVMYAPAGRVPRAQAFPTSPVSADAVVLMGALVVPSFAGQGLGRVLVQSAAKDLLRREVRAIEAFGQQGPPPEERPVGGCVLPVDFLLAVGFKTVRPHHRWPRLRLDLRTAVSWRGEVEVALERLLGSISPQPASAINSRSAGVASSPR